ncbi:serine/threonine protein kinase [Kribbella steppae]|uniref:non-specific serine/threonine protein kinase n=1 Tax=Kribbella steppae TaxID=2512223 RepID=A0A4V2RZG6_9ACTN|nr:serine/threonine protein kinase [Kribbella steppae]
MHRGDLIAGRYELVARLGRGGMGEVWTCRDRELRRDVAVKFLALDDAVTPDLAQRFDREAVAAAQINHPNVVALHDRGLDKDHLYLVMERVEGTTLAAHLRSTGPLAPGRALEIAQEICAALVAAHKAHVIHYDIKPLNVMLTADERVKVVDFGIAGFVQTTFTVARSADLPTAGTPEYGAPEQFGTERGDERSDLYALGGVLFTLLTAQPPFTGPNGFAVVQRKLSEPALSVASLRPDLPPAVVHLVDDLLRRDPDQRPQKAAEVQERIARLRAALDVLDLSNAATVVAKGLDFVQPTRRLSGNDSSFEIGWADHERSGGRGVWLTVALWFCWLLFLAFVIMSYVMPSIYGSVDWQPAAWIDFLLHSPAPGRHFSVIGIIGSLILAVVVTRRARRPQAARPWSLRIGPDGITTTDASGATAATGPSGRRTFAWNHIKMVTLEEIRAKMLNRDSGLHIRFAHDAPYNGRFRPAGWIHSQATAVRQDGSIPLCVLGPLTEQEHADLVAALNHHAGPRWHPEIGYLDGAV